MQCKPVRKNNALYRQFLVTLAKRFDTLKIKGKIVVQANNRFGKIYANSIKEETLKKYFLLKT